MKEMPETPWPPVNPLWGKGAAWQPHVVGISASLNPTLRRKMNMADSWILPEANAELTLLERQEAEELYTYLSEEVKDGCEEAAFAIVVLRRRRSGGRTPEGDAE